MKTIFILILIAFLANAGRADECPSCRVEVLGGKGVKLSRVSVCDHQGQWQINGTITRDTGYSAQRPLRLRVDWLGEQGKILQSRLEKFSPGKICFNRWATARAFFHARFDPVGIEPVAVRVRVVDAQTLAE